MQISGITVRVLRMNDEDRVEVRQVFAKLGEYPYIGNS